MNSVLAGVLLSTLHGGAIPAHHNDVMTFLFGGALSMSLEEFDACIFDGGEVRAYEAMTQDCQTAMEPCRSRMHLEPDEMPHDIGRRVLLERCLREDASRYHILLQRHASDVLARFPQDADDAARSDAMEALVDVPQEAANAGQAACLETTDAPGDIATYLCARDWRLSQLIQSRQLLKESFE